MTHGPRRTSRLLLGALVGLTAVLGVSDLVAAPPASAATLTAPSAVIAFGDRSLTLAWQPVPGATRYRVQYSTSSTFQAPVTKDAGTRTSLMVTGLQNDRRYHARVVAVAGPVSKAGRSLSATPDSGYPRELRVTAVPAGTDRIRVSWTGQGRATKVGVRAGSNSLLTREVFTTAWYPATTTSVVLTVPPSLRAQLGTGSGNPIYVKVATYNSPAAGQAMPDRSNSAASYRLSAPGTRVQASPVAPAGSRLRVATYNVKTVTSSAALPGRTWRDRRLAVAAGIARSGAAVVAVQELTGADAGLGNGTKQWEDLRDLLARPGYGGYALATTGMPPARVGVPRTTVGDHLFYRPDLVTREAAGLVSPRHDLRVAWTSSALDHFSAWGRFRVRTSGRPFYAVSVHLPVDVATPDDQRALRVRIVSAIEGFVAAKAGRLPIVLAGDLNSHVAKTPNGPETWLRTRGYYDAAASLSRANDRVHTANSPGQVDNLATPGFPSRPHLAKYTAQRIDYIMVKNSPGSWRYVNQLVLVEGLFDRRYQGSDHNLQWAEVGIR
ncbi:fibronectin type III domain-containing protein [Geodermatophilus sp. SYSU D00697]